MNINMRQLKGFLLISRLGSFTLAAEKMHITQSGLSAMMQDMEKAIGCRLFDRTTRSVSLTTEGKHMLPVAEVVMEQLEGASLAVRRMASERMQVLTIAVSHVFATLIAPTVRRNFQAKAPSARLKFIELERMQIQSMIESGTVDAGLGITWRPSSGIDVIDLFDLDLIYICSRRSGARLPHSGPLDTIKWSDLPPTTMISLAKEIPIQQIIDSHFQSIENEPNQIERVGSMLSALAMVGEGFGASVLPSLVMPMCYSKRYSVYRLVEPGKSIAFQQMTKAGKKNSDLLSLFAETLIETMSQMCKQPPDSEQDTPSGY